MKSKSVTIGLTALLMSSVIAGGALAHERGSGKQMTFEELDVNSDGQITQSDIEARMAARFSELDTNADGFVTAEEIAARQSEQTKRRARRAERMIERLDTNEDGKLSQSEMASARRGGGKFLERFDTNGDGAISKEEFAELAGKWGKKRRNSQAGD